MEAQVRTLAIQNAVLVALGAGPATLRQLTSAAAAHAANVKQDDVKQVLTYLHESDTVITTDNGASFELKPKAAPAPKAKREPKVAVPSLEEYLAANVPSLEVLGTGTLKAIAEQLGNPAAAKWAKAKAVAALHEHLTAAATAKHAELASAKPRRSAGVAAPKGETKHGMLLAALTSAAAANKPATVAELMECSGFDAKNLSVAMCNLKRAGHVIKTTLVAVGDTTGRAYSL